MLNISQLRIFKNFKPLKIVSDNNCPNSYRILKDEICKVGSFNLSNTGEISSLVIEEPFRRKKTGLYALASVLDFCKKTAKEKGIDYLSFSAYDNNKNNVVRLYSKFSYNYNDFVTRFFVIPITKKGYEMVEFLKNPFISIQSFVEDVKNIIAVK